MWCMCPGYGACEVLRGVSVWHICSLRCICGVFVLYVPYELCACCMCCVCGLFVVSFVCCMVCLLHVNCL